MKIANSLILLCAPLFSGNSHADIKRGPESAIVKEDPQKLGNGLVKVRNMRVHKKEPKPYRIKSNYR